MSRIEEKIKNDGTPKKILACDGGGIRGLMSVEILAKIEADLRQETGNESLLLGDYFDMVCGTSTGAIIATCIAAGMSIAEIRQFYIDSGELMFKKSKIYERLKFKYDDEPLAKKLRAVINDQLKPSGTDATLGNENLRCILMLVLRNHSTDSPWPVWNNPKAKYNNRALPDCNLDIPLWRLVRASTAAPTFFPPETVTFAEGKPEQYDFVFVDGGVTTYNNPAFLAFQLATAAPYQLEWQTGKDDMLIVSVGTGNAAMERLDDKASDLWLLSHASSVPSALMNAASAGWDMACRNLGECRFGAPIDREFGGMNLPPRSSQTNSSVPTLFSYVRYNPDIDTAGLSTLGLADIKSENISQLDSITHIPDLQRVGTEYAKQHINIESHLAGFI